MRARRGCQQSSEGRWRWGRGMPPSRGVWTGFPIPRGRSPPATGTAVFRYAFSVARLTLAPWTCRSVSRTDADSAAALFASAAYRAELLPRLGERSARNMVLGGGCAGLLDLCLQPLVFLPGQRKTAHRHLHFTLSPSEFLLQARNLVHRTGAGRRQGRRGGAAEASWARRAASAAR